MLSVVITPINRSKPPSPPLTLSRFPAQIASGEFRRIIGKLLPGGGEKPRGRELFELTYRLGWWTRRRMMGGISEGIAKELPFGVEWD